MQFATKKQTCAITLILTHGIHMIGIDGMFTWGMQWRRRLPYSLQVTAGGSIDIDGDASILHVTGTIPSA